MYQNSHSAPASLDRELGLAVVEEPVEARAEVVVIVLQPLQPGRLLGALQGRLGLFGEREEVIRVPATDLVGLARGLEALTGKLADRLQHPEAPAGPPDEALVDERLQRVDVGADDLLGGVEGAAACEDRQPREQLPLRLAQELVGPLDRRPERLLAGIGVAAAFEQVEPLREAIADLRRRQNGGASGRQLDRERQIVEVPAEIGDLVVARKPRAGAEELLGLRPAQAAAPDTRPRPAAAATRGSSPAGADCGTRASSARELGGGVDHMLEVVEKQEQRAAADLLGETALAPSVCAIVSTTSAGSRRLARPTQKTPSG